MRKLSTIITNLLLSLMLLCGLVAAPYISALADATNTNLIANPGFETANGTTPADWTSESWGTNTAGFSYTTNNHSGTHAAETTVSGYQSGDAKWIFDPISVSSNAQYTYSDWSEATTTTNVWAQYTMSDGSVQYQWLDTFSAASSWMQNSVTFTTPADVSTATIYHVINTNGSLTIDDTDLSAFTPTSNLIANPGFETANGTTPADWTSESWGTNTTNFTYTNNSHGGGSAAETTVSNYQSGDAKWIFNPVPVTASTAYTYTDWYESDVTTNLWAQYTMSDGSVQYQWLAAVNPANTWAQSSVDFTTPTGVVTATIYHVINANGSLTIDDANLVVTSSCDVSNTNGIYNGGFEQTCSSNPSMPADWQTESAGSPDATYAYTTTAHSGNNAVETNMQGTSGEAGWNTVWQNVVSNQRYNLTFWHNGTTYVYAYVAERLTDGSVQYVSLMSVPATQNTGWSQYSDTFVTPTNVSQIQVTIATSGVGYFYLDDVYLNSLSNQSPVDFNQGYVSVTFDDGDASSYTNGYNEIKKLGLKGTFYINASTLGTSGYMSKADIKTMATAGEEIGSHEFEHLDIVTLTQAKLASELSENDTALHTILGASYPITDFASPYGSYTTNTLSTVMTYYQSHRTTDGEFNTKANLNPNTLHARLVTSSTTPAQVESWIQQAKQQDEWLILVYHAVGSSPLGGDGDGYATTPAHFDTEMTYLKGQTNVQVLPVNSALTQLKAQE